MERLAAQLEQASTGLPGTTVDQSARGDAIAAPDRAHNRCGVSEGQSTEDRGRRRKLLVIASRFPPVASVGAIRVRKFVKYLPQFGWDPVVITGAARSGGVSRYDARRAADAESLTDVPSSVPVHRLSAVLDNWPGFASRRLSGELARITGPVGLDEAWWGGALKWRLQKLHDRISFPDRGIARLPAAVRMARRLNREYQFDAVFSTGMPFSDHLIGLVISSLLRKPWVADFRDPWVEYIHWQQWEGSAGRRLTSWAEAAVVDRAAGVISVNLHMTRRFRDRYPRHAGKLLTIENGYDPDDSAAIKRPSPSRRFRILHAGSLYETRSPMTVLAAWRQFIRETPGSADHARLEFAGRVGPFLGEMNDPADDGTIRYAGMLPHREALTAMVEADANLIILPNLPGSESDTTAKMYECIGSGRAILATVPEEGAAARELRRHAGVWLVAPDDVEGICRAMGEMYRRWLSGSLTPRRDEALLASVTRRRQAGQLAGALEAVVHRRRIRQEVAL